MPKKVLAICGSVRAQSTNKRYIELIASLAENLSHGEGSRVLRGGGSEVSSGGDRQASSGGGWAVTHYEGLAALPAFNPDIVEAPPAVEDFFAQLAAADGVLICTPEYAMGPPGVLKNALDWTVGVSAFSQKPVALITASLAGQKGHAALMETLKVIEARIVDLVISHAQTKLNDAGTQQALRELVQKFDQLLLEEL